LTKINWFIRLAYDGTAYKGWQIQPIDVTVQGTLKAALTKLYETDDFELFGSSRTDAGVHALDQCVTFRPPQTPYIPPDGMRKALASILPIDIRIQSIEEMPEDFHVRFDSRAKAYTYLIYHGRLSSPFLGRCFWSMVWDLDLDRMKEAAQHMLGEHDFAPFAVNVDKEKSSRRELIRIDFAEHDNLLAITVVGGSFLYKMMRRIIGFLVKVGVGEIPVDAPVEMHKTGTTCGHYFVTAPPQGLFLERTFFDRTKAEAFVSTELPYLQLMK
jgi:tRNA pseudouridine38-40 synthase